MPLLILDGWLRDPLAGSQACSLLEIIDDRCGQACAQAATQVHVEDRHACFPDPSLADAVLDRFVHTIPAQDNAYRLVL